MIKQNIVKMLSDNNISFIVQDIEKDNGIYALLTVHSGDIGLVFSKETDQLLDVAHLSDANVSKDNNVTKEQLPTSSNNIEEDTGKHYRRCYKGVNLDPYRISRIYNVEPGPQQDIIKKGLCMGERGHKDKIQDLKDIITAAQRGIQMILEDTD